MSKWKPSVFQGAACAIVTPFSQGKIDFECFGKLIERQISLGIDALVIAGTTGEAATLTHEEHCELIRHAVEKTAGRIPVIAGTGSNDTAYSIALSRYACDVGADALLAVTPYYNKTSPRGLTKSFLALADAVSKPVILYNVPSRTGCNIPLAVYRELAEHERIVAVKEASGNIGAIAELAAECSDRLDIYSGNDDQIVPLMSLGGKGVISVLANLLPDKVHTLTSLCLEQNFTGSASLQLHYLPLIRAIFSEVNPIPVKTAMEIMGLCPAEMRLPLCEAEESTRQALVTLLKKEKMI